MAQFSLSSSVCASLADAVRRPSAQATKATRVAAPVSPFGINAPSLSQASRTLKSSTICRTASVEKEVLEFVKDPEATETAYLTNRTLSIRKHFPSALSVDDFMHRLEIALYAYNFTGDNSIACSNLCRDEITITLKKEIDKIFGSSFNTNGLGGIMTCGVTGMKAGLSHSPVCGQGKERYVFFAFPHISIDSTGAVGKISRPGRAGESCACGALIGSLVQIKAAGLAASCKQPGVHDYEDPELSILKQRIARRMKFEGWTEQKVQEMDLVEITTIAERTIADDLEYLIGKAVDTSKADYAVVTGVQIHNWGAEFDDGAPNLEYVAPTGVYVVVNGEKTYLNLSDIPSLTPRQIQLLSGHSAAWASQQGHVCNNGADTIVRSIDAPFLYSSSNELKQKQKRALSYVELMAEEGGLETVVSKPEWTKNITTEGPEKHEGSTIIDEMQTEPDVAEITREFLSKMKSVAIKTINK